MFRNRQKLLLTDKIPQFHHVPKNEEVLTNILNLFLLDLMLVSKSPERNLDDKPHRIVQNSARIGQMWLLDQWIEMIKMHLAMMIDQKRGTGY